MAEQTLDQQPQLLVLGCERQRLTAVFDLGA